MRWHREITRQQWRTLFAAQLGWMLDAMDVMLYSFALTTIRTEFHLSFGGCRRAGSGAPGDLRPRAGCSSAGSATASAGPAP